MSYLTTAQALAVLAASGMNVGSGDDFDGFETPHLGADIELLGSDVELLGADALELLGADSDNLSSLLGADALELLGADAIGLLGADRARKRGIAPRGAAIMQAARIQKELFLPVPSTSLPSATPTAIINVQPQLTCQINQLVIPSNVGPFFLINDVIIGTRSQFAAPGAVSGVGLSEVQTGSLKGDTATLGTIISVSVTNISGVDKVLQGAYFRVRALVK